MDSEKQQRDYTNRKSTFVQIVLGLIVNFSSLSPSMSLGFSAVALPYLLDTSNPHHLTEGEASWFASVTSIAAPFGCFLSGPISDKFGRKSAIICINVFCFLGWIFITIAYYIQDYQYLLLLIGRFLTGFSAGLSSMPAAVYMAEISTSKLRGMFITWNALCFSLGVVIIYILGWIMTNNWGMIAISSTVFPCACMVMVMVYVVESPSWLIANNRLEEAKASICKLYDAKEHTLEMHEEYETLINSTNTTKTGRNQFQWRFLLEPVCYRPFILMSTFFLFQQLSGTFVIVFYAIDIVNEVKITIDPYCAIVLIATTRTVASGIVSMMSKRIGRRPLSLASGIGMTICMVVLAVYTICIKKRIIMDDQFDWLPLTFLMAYYFTATLGFLTMPFAMSAEVFPSKVRGLATGMVTSIGYICSFVMVKLYPDMLHYKLGIFPLFLFYAAMSAAGTVFVALRLPETKGKTLSEIEENFNVNNNKKAITIELESVSLNKTL
ncbi:hypothetical protein RI129_013130 [Pyrocoelia pectoralis]|uniref:Major facilitator superfamily (MFS) profile domain-containing protein n=1 Tax=Pyrocoelia pectoralis TaxID=417401 RepID=A0AAN7UVN5_9COLE